MNALALAGLGGVGIDSTACLVVSGEPRSLVALSRASRATPESHHHRLLALPLHAGLGPGCRLSATPRPRPLQRPSSTDQQTSCLLLVMRQARSCGLGQRQKGGRALAAGKKADGATADSTQQ